MHAGTVISHAVGTYCDVGCSSLKGLLPAEWIGDCFPRHAAHGCSNMGASGDAASGDAASGDAGLSAVAC